MALENHHLAILESTLVVDFVPDLPALRDQTKPPKEQQRKNLSRAFAGFSLRHICDIPPKEASESVIDDFDDYGVDAIYYHAPTETLYLVQAKLKVGEQVRQEDALAFCQGVRLLLKQEFDTFNQNVQKRRVEIEDALDSCNSIRTVIAHIGAGISEHARKALGDFLTDENQADERLQQHIIDYDAQRVVGDLQQTKAYETVNIDLSVHKCTWIKEPRETYFGLIKIADLVDLHEKYGKALYAKNIRNFLGHTIDVNAAIQATLGKNPDEFVYLNNGVTALCEKIEPKGAKKSNEGAKKLKLRGFSVINGAQTIASAAKFSADHRTSDISSAKVSLTLIKAYSDSDFAKAVTRSRNYQNPVLPSNFAALDDEQERLRREISYLGFHYAYKAEASEGHTDVLRIRIDEAAQALALTKGDPRYAIWSKKEPARMLDTGSDQYKELFNPSLTAFTLVNSVLINRYVQSRMATETLASQGQERLTYKHGNLALAWVLIKRLVETISSAAVVNTTEINASLSAPFDQLRNILWTRIQPAIALKGPLALFRNQTDTIPLLQDMATDYYGLNGDPLIAIKRGQHKAAEQYPEALFAYLVSKAPQIQL